MRPLEASVLKTDVLVIGGGAAGMRAAIEADACNRANAVKPEIRFCLQREPMVDALLKLRGQLNATAPKESMELSPGQGPSASTSTDT